MTFEILRRRSVDDDDGVVIFHAGTRRAAAGGFETNGGRVLGVTARGDARVVPVAPGRFQKLALATETAIELAERGLPAATLLLWGADDPSTPALAGARLAELVARRTPRSTVAESLSTSRHNRVLRAA